MSGLDVPPDIFVSIEREISSESSPVGIDRVLCPKAVQKRENAPRMPERALGGA